MVPFKLSTVQADRNDTSTDPLGGNWVPLCRTERPKTPYELLVNGSSDQLSLAAYLLIRKAVDGDLSKFFRDAGVSGNLARNLGNDRN